MRARTVIAASILALITALLPFPAHSQWTPGGVLISYGGYPNLVSDGVGGVIAVWDAGGQYIRVQHLDAGGTPQWGPNGVTISSSPGAFPFPQVVPDGSGGAIVVWGAQLRVQRVDAHGVVQWTPGGVIVRQSVDHPGVAAVSDGAGGVLVAWGDYRSSSEDVYVQKVNAAGVPQWTTNGVALSNSLDEEAHPSVVSDGSGGAIVLWDAMHFDTTYYYYDDSDILAQRVDATGSPTWMIGGVRLDTGNWEHLPSAVSDESGGAIFTHYGAGIFAQRIDGAGTLQWGTGISLGTFEPHDPYLVPDEAGGAVIAWHEDDDVRDIFAQRFDASGAPQWPQAVPISTAPGNQVLWDMAPDGSGGALITWHDFRMESNYRDVYAQHVHSWGTTEWDQDGAMIANGYQDQKEPTIVSDGSGGAIIAWVDSPSGGSIRAQHVASNITSVNDTPALDPVRILANYPNPFSAGTLFEIVLPHEATVTADAYDVTGHRVHHASWRQNAGRSQVWFGGRDDAGAPLPGGVYFYRLGARGSFVTRKIVVAR